MTAIQAQNLQGNVIHTWFRCLLKLPPSHEGLAEFTRYFLLFLQAWMFARYFFTPLKFTSMPGLMPYALYIGSREGLQQSGTPLHLCI